MASKSFRICRAGWVVTAFVMAALCASRLGVAASLGLDVEQVSSGNIKLRWPAVAGAQLESAEALMAATLWLPVPITPVIRDGVAVVEVSPAAPTRFYRVRGPALTTLVSSPADRESGISANRETVFTFSRPLRADVMLKPERFTAFAAGRKLLTRIELSSDRRRATLFFLEPMPAAARVQIRFDATEVVDEFGQEVDANGDGQPGGLLVVSFDTGNRAVLVGTAVTGRVMASERIPDPAHPGKLTDLPIPGAIIAVDGAEESLRAITDGDGRFILSPAPAGRVFVHIDGRQANGSTWPVGAYYPFVGKAWEIEAGRTNNLAGGTGEIFLPLVPAETLQPVSLTQDTRIALPPAVLAGNPALAGVEIIVPSGALFDDAGNRGGKVGIALVPPDRLPGPLPPGVRLPLVITVQTDGAQNFDRPAPICFPNVPDEFGNRLPPGTKAALMSFDHDTGEWARVGSMTVSGDGSLVCSDPGSGILKPGWHGRQYPDPTADPGPPPPPPPASPPTPPLPEPYPFPCGPNCPLFCTHQRRMDRMKCHQDWVECIRQARGLLPNMTAYYNQVELCELQYQACLGDAKFNDQECRQNCNLVCPQPAEVRPVATRKAGPRLAAEPGDELTGVTAAVVSNYTQIVDLLRPYFQTSQSLPAEILAEIDALETDADQRATGDAAAYVRAEFFQLEAERVSTLGPQGEFRGDQPAYPIHYAYEFIEQKETILCDGSLFEWTTNIISGLTDPYGQYRIYLRNSRNRNPKDPNCQGGGIVGYNFLSYLSRVFFYDARTQRYGEAFPRRIPGLASGISGFVLHSFRGAQDSDHDGLPDVVERILGTDPNNPDSDGDGIFDGAEVEGGANPQDSRPAITGIIATLPVTGTAVDVAAFNDFAALALGANGVAVFDVRDAQNPVLAGLVKTPGTARAVALDRDQAVVADGAHGIAVISLRGVNGPELTRSVAVGSPTTSITASGGFGFVGCEDGSLVAVELSSGSAAQHVNVGERVDDVAIAGDYVFVTSPATLFVYRWTDFVLTRVGSQALGFSFQADPITGRRRLAVVDGIAYLTAFPGYGTFDVHNPGAIQRLTPPVDFAPNSFKQIVPTGSGLGLAAVGVVPRNLDPKTHNVQLWDLSDPRNPQQVIRQFDTPGLARAVTIYNGLGYVADGEAGLQVINYLPFDTGRKPPVLTLTTSAEGNEIEEGKLLRLTAGVTDDVQVRNVEFLLDGALVAIDGNAPFEVRLLVPARTADKTSIKVRARARDTGGNEALSAELELNLVPDHTPPIAAPFTPAANRFAGSPTEVGVRFNEPIAADSLQRSQFRITFAGADRAFGTADDELIQDGSLVQRADGRLVFVVFDAPLVPGRYRVELLAGARDLAGNASRESVSWEFQAIAGSDSDGDGDADNDGASNLAESSMGSDPHDPHSLDPNLLDGEVDRDHDGLPDAVEVLIGTDPLVADTDGDGWSDGAEYSAGSNPLLRSSTPLFAVSARPAPAVTAFDLVALGPMAVNAVALPGVFVTFPAPPLFTGALVARPPTRVLAVEPTFLVQGATAAPQAPHLWVPQFGEYPGAGAAVAHPPVRAHIGDVPAARLGPVPASASVVADEDALHPNVLAPIYPDQP